MKHVPIAEFKARCSHYIDEIAEEEIVITRHGKPVARVLPPPAERRQDIWEFYDSLKGKYSFDPDVTTGLKWDAES